MNAHLCARPVPPWALAVQPCNTVALQSQELGVKSHAAIMSKRQMSDGSKAPVQSMARSPLHKPALLKTTSAARVP
eukprot:6212889-Pleurochrysis_carterae.AAC.3